MQNKIDDSSFYGSNCSDIHRWVPIPLSVASLFRLNFIIYSIRLRYCKTFLFFLMCSPCSLRDVVVQQLPLVLGVVVEDVCRRASPLDALPTTAHFLRSRIFVEHRRRLSRSCVRSTPAYRHHWCSPHQCRRSSGTEENVTEDER